MLRLHEESYVFQSVNLAGEVLRLQCLHETLTSFWAACKRLVLPAATIYTHSRLLDRQNLVAAATIGTNGGTCTCKQEYITTRGGGSYVLLM